MSWVRLDDGFTNHPKIVQLSDSEFRTWIRLLCYCARVEDPTVDSATRREVAGLSIKRITRFTELGLLDSTDGGPEIHDWAKYRKKDETNAERQARWRARKKARGEAVPNYSEWEKTRALVWKRDGGVCVDCGNQSDDWNADHDPDREVLLGRGDSIHDLQFIFTRCHSCHARRTRSNGVTSNRTEPLLRGTVTSLARDQARRRVPVPEIQKTGLSLAMEREAIGFQISQSLRSAS